MNRSQLTGETSTRANGTFSYGYDGGTAGGPGNPTSFKGTTNTFNANNQVTNSGYTYDGNGNPTTYKNTALTFDAENRMTGYGGTTQTNAYDGDGLRAWTNPGYNGKNYFVYDGDQRLLVLNSNGSVQYYLTFGANGLLSMHNTAVSTDDRYFTFDLCGATVARLAPNQSVQYTIGGQSSFGWCNPTDTMGGMGAQWGYFSDGATGLILCTHRFYDPGTGRFVTRDPAGYGGGINLYGYTGNDPVNGLDALGWWTIGIGVSGSGTLGPVGIGISGTIKIDSGGTVAISGSVFATGPGGIPVTSTSPLPIKFGTSEGGGGSFGPVVTFSCGDMPIDSNGITSHSGGISAGNTVSVGVIGGANTTPIAGGPSTTSIYPVSSVGVGTIVSAGGSIGVNVPGVGTVIDDQTNKGIVDMYGPPWYPQ